jgi:hypothetical protein
MVMCDPILIAQILASIGVPTIAITRLLLRKPLWPWNPWRHGDLKGMDPKPTRVPGRKNLPGLVGEYNKALGTGLKFPWERGGVIPKGSPEDWAPVWMAPQDESVMPRKYLNLGTMERINRGDLVSMGAGGLMPAKDLGGDGILGYATEDAKAGDEINVLLAPGAFTVSSHTEGLVSPESNPEEEVDANPLEYKPIHHGEDLCLTVEEASAALTEMCQAGLITWQEFLRKTCGDPWPVVHDLQPSHVNGRCAPYLNPDDQKAAAEIKAWAEKAGREAAKAINEGVYESIMEGPTVTRQIPGIDGTELEVEFKGERARAIRGSFQLTEHKPIPLLYRDGTPARLFEAGPSDVAISVQADAEFYEVIRKAMDSEDPGGLNMAFSEGDHQVNLKDVMITNMSYTEGAGPGDSTIALEGRMYPG